MLAPAALASEQLSDHEVVCLQRNDCLQYLQTLQISLQQFDRAEQTLLLAEGRYGKSHDPIFIFELNTNKALLEDRRQQLAYAALYRQRALDAILPTGHSGKIVVALGNLARTQQLQGHYQPARLHYQQALPYLASGTDEITRAVYLLRLAELSWQLRDLANGRQYVRQVQFASLPSEHHRRLYQQLHQQFPRI